MAVQTHHCDICVVGSGAIGKAAALGLAQAGYKVSLVGLSPPSGNGTDDWDIRVYALNQVAMNLLSDLKVWGALDHARIAPVSGMAIYDQSASANARLAFDAYSACTEELAWIVEDRNLNQALDQALHFAPQLKIFQAQANGMQVRDSAVQLRLGHGELIDAALVIGADGAQSWVRAQTQIGLDYRSYGHQGVVANFTCELAHHGMAHQWFIEDQGIIALLPLPGQRVALVWSAPDELARQLVREPQSDLAARLAPYAGALLGLLHPLVPERVGAFPLCLQRPHAMIAPRVALMGDAAHVVHPLAGHGMNLGFGDLACLLEQMRNKEQHRDCGDARLLGRYQRARKEQVLLMQFATDTLARLFASDLEPVRLARNLGMNLLDRIPVLKKSLIAHAMGK